MKAGFMISAGIDAGCIVPDMPLAAVTEISKDVEPFLIVWNNIRDTVDLYLWTYRSATISLASILNGVS